MNGPNNILVGTNLIIFGIGGNEQVRELLEDHSLFISVITEIELLSINKTKSPDSILHRLKTEAPITLRIPIPFVRLSATIMPHLSCFSLASIL